MKVFLILIVAICFISAKSQNLKPDEKNALLRITVSNFSNKPLPGETIIFISKKTKATYTVRSNQKGEAQILLSEGDEYDIQYRDFMEQQEYTNISIPDKNGVFTYDLQIKFEPAKTYTLKNVHFETGKATLKPESYVALNELVEAMKAKPALIIEIAGHTDNIGGYEYNLKLSQARAETVRNYLISKGINPERVIAKGYADTQPIASNTTEEGRSRNRRTEVRIIKE